MIYIYIDRAKHRIVFTNKEHEGEELLGTTEELPNLHGRAHMADTLLRKNGEELPGYNIRTDLYPESTP